MTYKDQINSLRPGERTEPIVTEYGSTWVERSGDGKRLYFVRRVGEVETVYLTEQF